MESVGFKEWALVCEALGAGEQSVILRKGGIAEGRAGFQFHHREFFLFPTFFHEQIEKIRLVGARVPERCAAEIEIKFFAKLEEAVVITSWEIAAALEPFHILRPEIVRERFEYDKAPGIHAGFVRIFRLPQPWVIPELAAYGGCRSWVKLPEPPEAMQFEAVLSDQEHAIRLDKFRAVLARD